MGDPTLSADFAEAWQCIANLHTLSAAIKALKSHICSQQLEVRGRSDDSMRGSDQDVGLPADSKDLRQLSELQGQLDQERAERASLQQQLHQANDLLKKSYGTVVEELVQTTHQLHMREQQCYQLQQELSNSDMSQGPPPAPPPPGAAQDARPSPPRDTQPTHARSVHNSHAAHLLDAFDYTPSSTTSTHMDAQPSPSQATRGPPLYPASAAASEQQSPAQDPAQRAFTHHQDQPHLHATSPVPPSNTGHHVRSVSASGEPRAHTTEHVAAPRHERHTWEGATSQPATSQLPTHQPASISHPGGTSHSSHPTAWFIPSVSTPMDTMGSGSMEHAGAHLHNTPPRNSSPAAAQATPAQQQPGSWDSPPHNWPPSSSPASAPGITRPEMVTWRQAAQHAQHAQPLYPVEHDLPHSSGVAGLQHVHFDEAAGYLPASHVQHGYHVQLGAATMDTLRDQQGDELHHTTCWPTHHVGSTQYDVHHGGGSSNPADRAAAAGGDGDVGPDAGMTHHDVDVGPYPGPGLMQHGAAGGVDVAGMYMPTWLPAHHHQHDHQQAPASPRDDAHHQHHQHQQQQQHHQQPQHQHDAYGGSEDSPDAGWAAGLVQQLTRGWQQPDSHVYHHHHHSHHHHSGVRPHTCTWSEPMTSDKDDDDDAEECSSDWETMQDEHSPGELPSVVSGFGLGPAPVPGAAASSGVPARDYLPHVLHAGASSGGGGVAGSGFFKTPTDSQFRLVQVLMKDAGGRQTHVPAAAAAAGPAGAEAQRVPDRNVYPRSSSTAHLHGMKGVRGAAADASQAGDQGLTHQGVDGGVESGPGGVQQQQPRFPAVSVVQSMSSGGAGISQPVRTFPEAAATARLRMHLASLASAAETPAAGSSRGVHSMRAHLPPLKRTSHGGDAEAHHGLSGVHAAKVAAGVYESSKAGGSGQGLPSLARSQAGLPPGVPTPPQPPSTGRPTGNLRSDQLFNSIKQQLASWQVSFNQQPGGSRTLGGSVDGLPGSAL